MRAEEQADEKAEEQIEQRSTRCDREAEEGESEQEGSVVKTVSMEKLHD